MTLVMTWGKNTFKREDIVAASSKIIKVFTDVGIDEPIVKVAQGHVRSGYLTFDSIQHASQALDVYLEVKLEEKIYLGSGTDAAAIYLGWQRSPTQQDFNRRINAVVEFLKAKKL